MNDEVLAGRYYCCRESAGTDPALIGACDLKTEDLGEMLYYDQDADMCGIFQTTRSAYTIFGDQNTEVGEAVLEKTLIQEQDKSQCCSASNGLDPNLRLACEFYTERIDDYFMYMNGVCSKITAYNDFYFGQAPEIRYENETVTLDQCCLASLEAQSEEQKDQLLGACFYDTLERSKYYFQDDVCFNY